MAEPPRTLALTTELAGWLAAWRRARDKIRYWQEHADRAQQHITTALEAAGAGVGTLDGKPAVRWTTVTSHRVDGARLRADHPQLADQYSRPVISHRFTAAGDRDAP